MGATPQYGSMFFVGLSSGKTYATDCYVSDVAGAKITFDEGAGAGIGTADFITFDEPVSLRDFSIITGTADTEKIRIVSGGKPTRHVIRYSLHLNTLNNRPPLNISFAAGSRISAFQIAD